MSDDLDALRESLRTSINIDRPKESPPAEKGKDPDKVQAILSEMNKEISNISTGIQNIKGVLDHLIGIKSVDVDAINSTLLSLQTQQETLNQDVKMILHYLGYKDPIE